MTSETTNETLEADQVGAEADERPVGDPLQDFFTYKLVRLMQKLNAHATRYLQADAGVTLVQWRVIMLLGTLKTATQSEIVRLADIDKGLLSRQIKILVADGLVRTTQDRRDQRLHHLALSDAGLSLYNKMLPKMQARQQMLRDALTTEEHATVLQVIGKLGQAVDRDLGR